MIFQEKLKSLRKENNLTQEELAEKIFVSRTLISKYESGTVYSTKENITKLATFFNIDESELSDLSENDEPIINKDKRHLHIFYVLNSFIIFICFLFSLLTALPIYPKNEYSGYSCSRDPTPCYPVFRYEYHNGYELTLSNSNPILIFALLSALANIVLSIFTMIKKDNKTLKIVNYILFIINIFLFFFTYIYIFFYCRGANFDY